jgi:negative regulator of sigma E activity
MQVSAFVDGELPENEAELLVRRLSQDAVLRQQVAEYLAIGRIRRIA